jgi:hypothetical protein
MAKHGMETVVATIPECSFCAEPAAVDGKTTRGPWAYMCETHFGQAGIGLGVGVGQRLVLRGPSTTT